MFRRNPRRFPCFCCPKKPITNLGVSPFFYSFGTNHNSTSINNQPHKQTNNQPTTYWKNVMKIEIMRNCKNGRTMKKHMISKKACSEDGVCAKSSNMSIVFCHIHEILNDFQGLLLLCSSCSCCFCCNFFDVLNDLHDFCSECVFSKRKTTTNFWVSPFLRWFVTIVLWK